MQDVECPYCGEWQEIDHDDGYGYGEDQTYQQECSDCDKTFTYTTGIIFTYNAEQAECLNGGEHNYELTTTYPKWFSKMSCTMCDDERQTTEEEKKRYNIKK